MFNGSLFISLSLLSSPCSVSVISGLNSSEEDAKFFESSKMVEDTGLHGIDGPGGTVQKRFLHSTHNVPS